MFSSRRGPVHVPFLCGRHRICDRNRRRFYVTSRPPSSRPRCRLQSPTSVFVIVSFFLVCVDGLDIALRIYSSALLKHLSTMRPLGLLSIARIIFHTDHNDEWSAPGLHFSSGALPFRSSAFIFNPKSHLAALCCHASPLASESRLSCARPASPSCSHPSQHWLTTSSFADPHVLKRDSCRICQPFFSWQPSCPPAMP